MTVLAMNLGTEHKTYEKAGFRNVLNEMCKSFEGRGRRAALGMSAGIPGDTAGGTNYCRQMQIR